MSQSMLNLNIGVLGHVDSGKTSLCKSLSTTSSTASFDKNPQSQERGITIDLGFSSFLVELPAQFKSSPWTKVQLTLVDCPGHASLIRTIIGGSQIIDMMLLVIDVTKGMQTQTAECLIIGEITCSKMIVVLNKTDLLPEAKRVAMIEKMTKKMKLTLGNSIFKNAPVVSVAAKPGGPDVEPSIPPAGLEELINTLREHAFIPERHILNPFLFSVDHCFSIRGQGTIMTGTVLQGTVNVNDMIEIPLIHVTKKVKSMQMFRQPVDKAVQGDRLGICVTQFDPKQLERGVVCKPGFICTISAAVISIQKIKYFKGNVNTKAKFHISIGHETVMAKLTVFGNPLNGDECNTEGFNFDQDYKYLEELQLNDGNDKTIGEVTLNQYALLEFEKPVLAVPHCLIIGSKLDIDIHVNTCRLAFWGRLIDGFEDKNYIVSVLPKLRIYKEKHKQGVVERVVNQYEVIGKGFFKKETNLQLFVGLKVQLSTGEDGTIESSFGQSGKVKIQLPDGLKESTSTLISNAAKKKGKKPNIENIASETESVKILLEFKRYIYDSHKKMIQT